MFGLDVIGGLLESKAKIPNAPSVDLQADQIKAIKGNDAELAPLEGLATKTNQFNFDQISKFLGQAIPGLEGMKSGVQGNIDAFLKGQIPADVIAQIGNADASRALSGGYSGAGLHGNLNARDLGLTSLQLTQQGISSAESWITKMASFYEPSMFNISSMFVTPQQQAAQDWQNQEAGFQRDWMSNQQDAAHSFGTIFGNSLISTDQQLSSIAGKVAGKYLGGLVGGGGGGD